MANVSKINGYDIKDAYNREQTEELASSVNIISEDLEDERNTIKSKLCLSRLGRFNLTSDEQDGYSNMQAGCYVGNNIYIFPLIKNDSLGSARLYKVNLATGEIIEHNDVTALHHANGCCQKGSKLYFTQTFDDELTPLYRIIEVDIDTLGITYSIPIDFGEYTPFQINGIGYDEVNNKFYLIGADKFATTDVNFVVDSIVELEYPHTTYRFNQGGCYYGNYVCVLINSENAILCFNLDGTLHHVIDIGKVQANNVMGELENITVYDDEIYINANLNHSSPQNLFLVQFFKADIRGGGLPNKYANNSVFNNATINRLVVDKTTYNSLSDYEKFTCNGTTDKPFESIAEAISYIDNNELYQIDVNDTNTYSENLTIINKNLIIKANGSTLGTVKIVGSKVIFTNMYIDTSEYRTPLIGSPDDYNTPLYISGNSEVSLYGVCGYHSADCISDGMVYPLIIEGSTLYDNSSADGNYKKFLDVNSTYSPLIIGSSVITGNVGAIKSPKMNFVDYRPTTSLITGDLNISFTDLPQYTNQYRGLWIAVTTEIGNSPYVRLSQLHANEQVIVEDLTGGTNKRYGFRFQLRPSQSRIEVAVYSYDHTNNVWVADNTVKWYPKYMFEI